VGAEGASGMEALMGDALNALRISLLIAGLAQLPLSLTLATYRRNFG